MLIQPRTQRAGQQATAGGRPDEGEQVQSQSEWSGHGPLSINNQYDNPPSHCQRYSSTTGDRRWISSIKRTSLASSDVRIPARSPESAPGRADLKARPAHSHDVRAWFYLTRAAREATRGQATPPHAAALTNTFRFSTILSWPLKSSKVRAQAILELSAPPPVSGDSYVYQISSAIKGKIAIS